MATYLSLSPQTRAGHQLEDVTWLEAFLLLSYPSLSEADLLALLAAVPSVTDVGGSVETPTARTPPVAAAMLTVLARLRERLR